jgi:hypothetical protein
MAYMIAELKETEQGGFAPRGAAKQLWQSRAPEVIIAGPAETGKTWACMQKLHALMWKYPGATAAIVRKSYASMHSTVLQTYRRVIGKDSPVKVYGGEKPQWYDYPNGSRIYIGGMDNPQKILSGERDFIVLCQAEELELDDYETLRTRNTGRGGVAPYAQTFGDCNPGPPTHWILERTLAGHLNKLDSRHEDNPTLFDEQGRLTEQGRRTMMVLDSLTGIRYKRLRLGLWAGAEGMVYEDWNPSIHVIDRLDIPADWLRFRTIDFGFVHPFTCQWWAQDADGRLFMYRELYGTQKLVEDWALDIHLAPFTREEIAAMRSDYEGDCASQKPTVAPGDRRAFVTWLRERRAQVFTAKEEYVFTLSDHDAEDRATLERGGINTKRANKDVSPGIQAVQSRLRVQADGRPRLFLFRDALDEANIDPWLKERHMPVRAAQEFEMYVWAKAAGTNGLLLKEAPEKKFDHGLDALRYLCQELDQGYRPADYTEGESIWF